MLSSEIRRFIDEHNGAKFVVLNRFVNLRPRDEVITCDCGELAVVGIRLDGRVAEGIETKVAFVCASCESDLIAETV